MNIFNTSRIVFNTVQPSEQIRKGRFFMSENTQLLTLRDRSKLTLSGVNEILSYTDSEILMFTNLGDLTVTGSSLELKNAFEKDGTVTITGYVKTLSFAENREKTADNFISRLFK